jgi:hypothetical protein
MNETEWTKAFVISSLTRENLVSHGFPQAVVEQLTDSDMQEIASAMEDIYFDTGFWEDMQLCTERILERKEEDAVLEQDVSVDHATPDQTGG